MATDPNHLDAEKVAEDLLELYAQTQQVIAARMLAAVRSGDLDDARRRRAQLAAILAALDQLGAQTDRQAERLVEQAYEEMDTITETAIGRLQIGVRPDLEQFNQVSSEAVRVLQESIVGQLQEARRIVGRTVADTYARAQRRSAMRALLGQEGSPRSAAADLSRELLRDREVRRMVQQGGVGFVDQAGRRWQLHTYARMATRTVIREAATQGAVNRMAAHGVNLARVRSEGDACPVCTPWSGRLVSLDGSTVAYQGEAVAGLGAVPNGGPPFHPNCRCALMPFAARIQAIRQELEEVTA